MDILHMTDLHFSRDTEENEIREKWNHIKIKLKEELGDKKVDVMAVTGDITCHGDLCEFRQAKKYLLELSAFLSVKREKIFFCPGNHDADTEGKGSSFYHYQSFLNEFYGKSEYDYPVKKKDKKTGEKRKFCFVSINTCTETSLQFFDEAFIPDDAFLQLDDFSDNSYVILLMHHQPEVIKNQECFMRIVNSGVVKLILSGHLHTTQTRMYRAGETTIVNGMAVTPHLQWIPAGFQLIHIKRNDKIKITEIKI
ncbi:MAG: metallophosphoesterase [Lachnospiraceae bacterium]|nr:metallophosphoesterase [Lachnospiraceae bacterium]